MKNKANCAHHQIHDGEDGYRDWALVHSSSRIATPEDLAFIEKKREAPPCRNSTAASQRCTRVSMTTDFA